MAVLEADVRYRIREVIDEQLDVIIPAIRDIVDDTEVYRERDMGKSQFSNLSSVARETDSVEAVVAWIEYQIGRTTAPGRGWRKVGRQDQAEFGVRLVKLLRELRRLAIELSRDFGAEDKEYRAAIVRQLWIGLVRQLVGQMERYVVFRVGTRERVRGNP